jgi:hypothetical protein
MNEIHLAGTQIPKELTFLSLNFPLTAHKFFYLLIGEP